MAATPRAVRLAYSAARDAAAAAAAAAGAAERAAALNADVGRAASYQMAGVVAVAERPAAQQHVLEATVTVASIAQLPSKVRDGGVGCGGC